MSEEEFNAILSQSQQIINLFFYGAMNIVYKEEYGKEFNIFANLNQITTITFFKNIKGFKVTDSIPYELIDGAEYEKDVKIYNCIGSAIDRYNKAMNLCPDLVGIMVNPALYTTPLTKEEYEALIDIPNIIV